MVIYIIYGVVKFKALQCVIFGCRKLPIPIFASCQCSIYHSFSSASHSGTGNNPIRYVPLVSAAYTNNGGWPWLFVFLSPEICNFVDKRLSGGRKVISLKRCQVVAVTVKVATTVFGLLAYFWFLNHHAHESISTNFIYMTTSLTSSPVRMLSFHVVLHTS